jgi:hypothetical protein
MEEKKLTEEEKKKAVNEFTKRMLSSGPFVVLPTKDNSTKEKK